jgi:hypothetical protein
MKVCLSAHRIPAQGRPGQLPTEPRAALYRNRGIVRPTPVRYSRFRE